MSGALNAQVAARLEEVAGIIEWQGANPYRVRAYRRAAFTLRGLDRPVSELLASGGVPALEALPGIGESLARSIRTLVETGRVRRVMVPTGGRSAETYERNETNEERGS